MQNDTSAVMRRATEARIKTPFSIKVKQWAEARTAVDIAAIIFIMAVMITATLWEANNAGLGYIMIAAGVVPKPMAWLFGFTLPIGYFWFHRRSSEFFRKGKSGAAYQAAIVALGFTILTLFGVFSNVASKTELQAVKAGEINADRALLRSELRALSLEVSDVAFTQAQVDLEITQQMIKSTEAEAVGWGMENTEPDGACAADLRSAQRRLCNRLNGSATDRGLRNELKLNEARLEALTSKAARLEEVKAQLATVSRAEGQGHWQAMSKVSMGTVSDDGFRVWGSFFLSFIVLIILGFGWDNFLEQREDEFDEMEASNG
jgi:hypothetical protein